MLALATHEPYFRVLREDVFANDTSPSACRMCGQEGHYAAQCTGTKADIQKKPPAEKKPFIFLDVAILREYLEVELDVPNSPFPFSLEQAIDDWVLLIFFVGNDFLPHLPSLEIREGAIDTLLKIWKQELPRMGGYLTNHGSLEMARAQIILEGLAQREDEIFRRRREAEERQDQNAKRRKIEQQQRNEFAAGPSQTLSLTARPSAPQPTNSTPHPLPQRPTNNNFAANADSMGLGAPATEESLAHATVAAQAFAGSNRDIVANRRAIRMANMSARDVLKAEMSGAIQLSPVKQSKNASLPAKPQPPPALDLPSKPESEVAIPGLDAPPPPSAVEPVKPDASVGSEADADGDVDPDTKMGDDTKDAQEGDVSIGSKRKFEEGPGDEVDGPAEDVVAVEDEEGEGDASAVAALKVNPDGTVEQEDTVK
jgi:5'-3' exoribonuclease 2